MSVLDVAVHDRRSGRTFRLGARGRAADGVPSSVLSVAREARLCSSSVAICATSSHCCPSAASTRPRASEVSTTFWRSNASAVASRSDAGFRLSASLTARAWAMARSSAPSASAPARNRPESSGPTTDRALTSTTGHGAGGHSGADRASLCAIVPVPSASNPALSAEDSESCTAVGQFRGQNESPISRGSDRRHGRIATLSRRCSRQRPCGSSRDCTLCFCGQRGGRIVDGPRRWPWTRPVDAPLRTSISPCRSSASPPTRNSARRSASSFTASTSRGSFSRAPSSRSSGPMTGYATSKLRRSGVRERGRVLEGREPRRLRRLRSRYVLIVTSSVANRSAIHRAPPSFPRSRKP